MLSVEPGVWEPDPVLLGGSQEASSSLGSGDDPDDGPGAAQHPGVCWAGSEVNELLEILSTVIQVTLAVLSYCYM